MNFCDGSNTSANYIMILTFCTVNDLRKNMTLFLRYFFVEFKPTIWRPRDICNALSDGDN